MNIQLLMDSETIPIVVAACTTETPTTTTTTAAAAAAAAAAGTTGSTAGTASASVVHKKGVLQPSCAKYERFLSGSYSTFDSLVYITSSYAFKDSPNYRYDNKHFESRCSFSFPSEDGNDRSISYYQYPGFKGAVADKQTEPLHQRRVVLLPKLVRQSNTVFTPLAPPTKSLVHLIHDSAKRPLEEIDFLPNAKRSKSEFTDSGPSVTTSLWEDENTLCYEVEVNGISVLRRADNDMINGTKLLNVTGMTRGRRDGILKAEKIRHVVKVGSMHLKGVWIPLERAKIMAQREKILTQLYPLFATDIKSLVKTETHISRLSTVLPSSSPSSSSSSTSSSPPSLTFGTYERASMNRRITN